MNSKGTKMKMNEWNGWMVDGDEDDDDDDIIHYIIDRDEILSEES